MILWPIKRLTDGLAGLPHPQMMVLSHLPEASIFPSGLKATLLNNYRYGRLGLSDGWREIHIPEDDGFFITCPKPAFVHPGLKATLFTNF